MRELLLFLKKLKDHWVAALTGGSPLALMFVAEYLFGLSFPRWLIGIFIATAIAGAAFEAWKDERKRAVDLEGELQTLRTAQEDEATTVPIRRVDDGLYWLLTIAATRGLRREFVNRGSQSLNAIWIGDIPISDQDGWFYRLVELAEKQGLLRPEQVSGGYLVYWLTAEADQVLQVEHRRRRKARPPTDTFHEARGGGVVDLEFGQD